MKRAINQYLLAAIFAFTAVSPVQAFPQEHVKSALTAVQQTVKDRPNISFAALAISAVLAWDTAKLIGKKAESIANGTEKNFSKDQYSLRKIVSILSYTGTTYALNGALQLGNIILMYPLVANDLFSQYPTLTVPPALVLSSLVELTAAFGSVQCVLHALFHTPTSQEDSDKIASESTN